MLKSDPEYEYTLITPEQIREMVTRIEAVRYTIGSLEPGAFAEVREMLQKEFPALGELQGAYSERNIFSIPLKIGEFIKMFESSSKKNGNHLWLPPYGYYTFGFPDLPESIPMRGIDEEHYLPKVFLGFSPSDIIEKKPEVPTELKFSVSRRGHDGIANGGDYGWVYLVYTDGNTVQTRPRDNSSSQHGHRLNYHTTSFDAVVTIQGASWIAEEHYYRGLIYSHNTKYIMYGNVPANFRRFKKEVA